MCEEEFNLPGFDKLDEAQRSEAATTAAMRFLTPSLRKIPKGVSAYHFRHRWQDVKLSVWIVLQRRDARFTFARASPESW